MPSYSNGTGVPLSVAVFLATDNYDYEPGVLSATSLIKPIRQLVLAPRVPEEERTIDIISLYKSRLGTALHDAIERAWLTNYATAMKALGYPEKIIDRVVVNPEPGLELPKDAIPVYMERRSYAELEGYKISGKFDFAAEGRLQDFKSTSVFTFTGGNKTQDYQLQGSIYRWLNQDILTDDHIAIQFLFTDWMPGRAKSEPNYPNRPVEEKLIPLLSLDDTEDFLRHKLRQFRQLKDAPEETLPRCNDQDLWRQPPVYKYYKNPQKMTRSTKNYDNRDEAYSRLAQDGGVGTVIEVPGQVNACKFCPAFALCTQKDELIANGSLQL